MGTRITAQYKGDCKSCGEDWAVGNQIYYQKEPKAICKDLECFKEQGGTMSDRSSGSQQLAGNWTRSKPIITKLPDCDPSDEIKKTADLWDQFFVVAHHRVHDLYPDEPITSDRFGQIRSKMMDQFMKIAQLNK